MCINRLSCAGERTGSTKVRVPDNPLAHAVAHWGDVFEDVRLIFGDVMAQ